MVNAIEFDQNGPGNFIAGAITRAGIAENNIGPLFCGEARIYNLALRHKTGNDGPSGDGPVVHLVLGE